MKFFANYFKAFCPNGNYFRFLFMRKALCLSDSNFDLPLKQSRYYNYCAKIHPVPTAVCFNSQIQRDKTSKAKSSSDQNDSDVSDDDEIENKDDESFSDEEVDFDTPLDYTHSLVHSLRADIIVAKGFSKSSRETEKMFYESKFLYRGKTLSKKAKKLDVGDYIDIIHEESKDKAKVQRVKVVKILNRQTKKGKPVVAIRVWKKPFETKKVGS